MTVTMVTPTAIQKHMRKIQSLSDAATSPGLAQGVTNTTSSTTKTPPSLSTASNTTATADDVVAKPLAPTPASAEGKSDASLGELLCRRCS